MELRSAKSWLDAGKDNDWRRTAVVGAGAVIGGLGLVWAARQLLPSLYFAPGWPGSRPGWPPAAKAGVGTAVGRDSLSTSLVWFPLGHGAINEVFYPRLDHPCIRDLALVITDGRRFVS